MNDALQYFAFYGWDPTGQLAIGVNILRSSSIAVLAEQFALHGTRGLLDGLQPVDLLARPVPSATLWRLDLFLVGVLSTPGGFRLLGVVSSALATAKALVWV